MIRQVTAAEADRMSAGCHPLLGELPRAAVFVGESLEELGRVKFFRQDWMRGTNGAVTHIEVRVPAADLVLVSGGGSMDNWWAMCREIHAVLELLVGVSGPWMASMHHEGGWHLPETFRVERRPLSLRRDHRDDFANLCLRAWSEWK